MVEELFSAFPIPKKYLAYGTAGFRDNVNLPLHSVFLRSGILATLRSLSLQSRPVGIMITASHNPECDNGVKIVDFDGGMLSQEWEPWAEKLANATSPAEFTAYVDSLKRFFNIIAESSPPVVFVGRDTRPHSKELADCVEKGIRAFGGTVIDLGEVTTPQLHFAVALVHESKNIGELPLLSVDFYKMAYYKSLSEGYIALIATHEVGSALEPDIIVVDASYGVGSIALLDLEKVVKKSILQFDVRNATGCGIVNNNCGAEIVQKEHRPPVGIGATADLGKLLCSFDGDADRIVFHSFKCNEWLLLDGDKIAALLALFLSQELREAGLHSTLSFGAVQTAYANGASREFFAHNHIPAVLAKTGVKYLHHKAQEFDVGVYFEANGHGTVHFSTKALDAIRALSVSKRDVPTAMHSRRDIAVCRLQVRPSYTCVRDSMIDTERLVETKRLQACLKVINRAVGDAISDMLLTLAALKILGKDVESWNGLYHDLPSKMIKIPVPDKNAITCSDDESIVISPASLQEALNAAMAKGGPGSYFRCFVRPSGTEDVVRIYAEAATPGQVDALVQAAVDAVRNTLG